MLTGQLPFGHVFDSFPHGQVLKLVLVLVTSLAYILGEISPRVTAVVGRDKLPDIIINEAVIEMNLLVELGGDFEELGHFTRQALFHLFQVVLEVFG